MSRFYAGLIVAMWILSPWAVAQQMSPAAGQVPGWVRYSGKVTHSDGRRIELTFAIYEEQFGGVPLWQESQSVVPDKDGAFSVLLGSTTTEGIPQAVFSANRALWLSMAEDGALTRDRALLVSVPYALKAADADTLQGRPATDFVQLSQLKAMLSAGTAAGMIDHPDGFAGPRDATPAAASVPTDLAGSTDTQVLLVEQDGTGYALKVMGGSNTAVFASNDQNAPRVPTIYGASRGVDGVAVRGDALAGSGSGIGMWGVTGAPGGTAVLGEAVQTTGLSYAVRGKNPSDAGVGVYGVNLSPTGFTTGVRGESRSPSGTAGVFDAYQGGQIFSGRSSGIEKLRIDGEGNLTAAGAVKGSSVSAASINSTGTVTAGAFVGDGSKLTNLNASLAGQILANLSSVSSQKILTGEDPDAFGFAGLVRDDLDSVHSITGQTGSQFHFRLSRATPDPGGSRDFLISPYKFGMSMEYPGVLEVWSSAFSIHANHKLGGNGPAQFWVGDESDTGGLWASAFQSTPTPAGHVELAADKFDHSSHGSIHFIVRNGDDAFRFFNGPLNQETITAQLYRNGGISNMEVYNGPMAAAFRVDSVQNIVQLGSRSTTRVDLITDDISPQVSIFPTGDVSVGSTRDTARLAVGPAAQFQVSNTGAVTIGSGTAIVQHLSAAVGVAFGPVPGRSCSVQRAALQGAAENDTVALGIPASLASAGDLMVMGWVSSADTVTLRACNMSDQDLDLPAGDIRIDVWKH